MGREVTGIQIVDRKPNGAMADSNGNFSDRVRVSPKIAAMVQAIDNEIKESAEPHSFAEKLNENKDVLSAKSTNLKAEFPEGKNEKSEVQKMGDDNKLNSPAKSISVDKEHTSPSSPQPSDQATEKHITHTQSVDTEAAANDLNMSLKADNMHSPNSSKNSQVLFHHIFKFKYELNKFMCSEN